MACPKSSAPFEPYVPLLGEPTELNTVLKRCLSSSPLPLHRSAHVITETKYNDGALVHKIVANVYAGEDQ